MNTYDLRMFRYQLHKYGERTCSNSHEYLETVLGEIGRNRALSKLAPRVGKLRVHDDI